jgi:hypothetical protein
MASSFLSSVDAKSLVALTKYITSFPDYPAGGISSPGWTDPSYVPPTRAPLIDGITFTLLPIALVIVTLRLYANKITHGVGWGAEDYCIIPAMVSIADLTTTERETYIAYIRCLLLVWLLYKQYQFTRAA